MASDQSLFWISGKAGSGKSTLMKYIANDKRTVAQLNHGSKSYAVYSYFIWNSAALMQRNIKGMYCSLLYQMLKDSRLLDRLLVSHSAWTDKMSHSDWEVNELKEALQETLRFHEQNVCLFLDGLDELDDGESPFDFRTDIQGLLSRVPKLKICVSSRPEPIWKTQLKTVPSVRVQDLTRRDMKTLAEELLQQTVAAIPVTPAPNELIPLVNPAP